MTSLSAAPPADLLEDGTLPVTVLVSQADRIETVGYSDEDRVLLVSFVCHLPADELEGEADLGDVFSLDVDFEGLGFSSRLVSVVDLGDA